MKKSYNWFRNLSRIGKVSIVTPLLFGAFLVSTGAAPAPEAIQNDVPVTQQTQAVAEKADPVVTTKVETDTEVIPFNKVVQNDATLAKGTTAIKVAGVNGTKTNKHSIVLTDGVETDRVTTSEVTVAPVDEVTAIGTYEEPVSRCDSNYSGCVPIVSYDLDCKDIGFSVTVLGADVHGFDRDRDGYGCESY